jgi:hypothetical protein
MRTKVKVSNHLLAGWVTVVVLTVVPTVARAVVQAFGFVLEGQPLGVRGLVRLAFLSFLAAVVYTVVVVIPAVLLLARVTGASGRPGWRVPAPALVISGVVDLLLFSRGYWLPDETLPYWPAWVAALAFGPAVYVYWSMLTSTDTGRAA